MYVLGIDVGTTLTKALILTKEGKVAASGSKGYPLISNGSHIEQRAEDWTDGVIAAVEEALKNLEENRKETGLGKYIEAISLSTQGASCVALNADDQPVGNALTWMDFRAREEAAELEEKLSPEYIYAATGWRASPSLDAAKIMHMKKQPEFASAVRFVSTLEYINLFLTGNAVIDPTNAAMRQLFNIERGCWDPKILNASGVREEELTPILPTGAKVGELSKDTAVKLKLRPGIPVFNGAHDQYCGAIGAGAVNDGDMLLSAGTTWVLLGIGTKPVVTDSYIAAGKHPVEGLYGALASLVGSGASMQWFKDQFIPEDFREMDLEAAKRKDPDLFFYPYLVGAAYPLWVRNAKGAFTGITLQHDRFDLARAVMEGVAFGVKRGLEDYANNGIKVKQLILAGGAAKSKVWAEMIADITGISLVRLNQADICAIGAGIIAAHGLGWYRSYEEAARAVTRVEHIYEPNDESRDYYEQKYRRYCEMWGFIQKFYERESGK
jgi:xylulokinase